MVVENVIFSSPLGGCLTWRPFATLPCCLTPPEYVTVILLVIAILFFFFSLVGVNAKKTSLSSSLQTARMVVFFFYYTRCNTPKHVRSSRGPSPRHCARATRLHSSFWRNVAAVASRWQHCVRFDRPEIWTSDLPLQRRTCCRLTY